MNRLQNEKSPYLKQHAHNPVNWYPWGAEAFETARKQNKLIFLSIGYSTCHWCHVMERESFEKENVAAILNESYISIKVDREERPDVDAIYMEAVQAMLGHGGWPMSVFLTPDLKPFYGGTYYPQSTFISLLKQITSLWLENPQKVFESGHNLFEWFKTREREQLGSLLKEEIFDKFLQQAASSFDLEKGGKNGAPKFPPSYETRLLLRIHRRKLDATSLHIAQTTLNAMARGGIYDHLGGGFHRYATDENWLVPHFEKMLYDQAALAHLYLDAFLSTKDPEYSAVLREILDYTIADLKAPRGGFYAAEDADSEGKEGTFYVWSETELQKILTGDEFTEFTQSFGVSAYGNFEGANILNLQAGHSRHQRSPQLKLAMQKVKAVRDQRIRPHRDEKILASWNGLMISAMARAACALNDKKYAQVAIEAIEFILTVLKSGADLKRRWIDGEAKFDGLLDDYAFVIDALIEVFQLSGDARYLSEARKLQQKQDELFWDTNAGAYFYSRPDDPSLIRRAKEFFDNVIPAANSIAALNLLRLSALLSEPELHQHALELFRAEPKELAAVPLAFPQLLMSYDYVLGPTKEVVVIAAQSTEAQAELQILLREFNPNKVLVISSDKNQNLSLVQNRPALAKELNTYYICERGECHLPVTDLKKALELLKF